MRYSKPHLAQIGLAKALMQVIPTQKKPSAVIDPVWFDNPSYDLDE